MRKQPHAHGGDPAGDRAGGLGLRSAARRRPAPAAATREAKAAKIGVIAPLSGDLSALGLGIQNSVDLAIKQANEKNDHPRLDARDRRPGRPGPARHRQERRHQAGRRRRRRRRRRHAELLGRPVGAAGAERRQHRPDLAGQHQPDPDPGRQPGEPEARPYPDVLPHLHHRRVQGPFAAKYLSRRGHQERCHDPRQEGLRPGSRRGLHRRVRGPAAARSPTAETINPDDKDFSVGHQQGQGRQPRGASTTAVSTRRPARWPAGQGRRPRRPADGW